MLLRADSLLSVYLTASHGNQALNAELSANKQPLASLTGVWVLIRFDSLIQALEDLQWHVAIGSMDK